MQALHRAERRDAAPVTHKGRIGAQQVESQNRSLAHRPAGSLAATLQGPPLPLLVRPVHFAQRLTIKVCQRLQLRGCVPVHHARQLRYPASLLNRNLHTLCDLTHCLAVQRGRVAVLQFLASVTNILFKMWRHWYRRPAVTTGAACESRLAGQ